MTGERTSVAIVASAIILLVAASGARGDFLELFVATKLTTAEAGLDPVAQKKRVVCDECLSLDWKLPDGTISTFLVERPPAALLPYDEIESVHVEKKPASKESREGYVIVLRTTEAGSRLLRDAASAFRQVVVYHDGEPIGLGGSYPAGSLYAFGSFLTLAEAEDVVKKLGLTADRQLHDAGARGE